MSTYTNPSTIDEEQPIWAGFGREKTGKTFTPGQHIWTRMLSSDGMVRRGWRPGVYLKKTSTALYHHRVTNEGSDSSNYGEYSDAEIVSDEEYAAIMLST